MYATFCKKNIIFSSLLTIIDKMLFQYIIAFEKRKTDRHCVCTICPLKDMVL